MDSCQAGQQRRNFSAIISCKNGFTLVELMITLGVAAILLMFIVPSFQRTLMNARVSMVIDGLFSSLNYARQTALEQNISVQLCPFNAVGSTSCGTNWSLGWIVVTQPTTGSPVLLRTYQASTSGPTLSATGSTAISFNARGLTTTQTNFKVCDTRGASFARSLMVLPTGFIQSGPTMGQAVWDGGTLACP